jgi:hypothetical protein
LGLSKARPQSRGLRTTLTLLPQGVLGLPDPARAVMPTKKATAAAYQMLQSQLRKNRKPLQDNKPSFDEFVVNMGGRAGRFFDNQSKEWAALLRNRKRMSEKSRAFLLAKLDRLIRETEKKIADIKER